MSEFNGLRVRINCFKPGWLCGSNLDNACAVFAYVSVGGLEMSFDGGCVNSHVPLFMVCGTSVLGSWYPTGIGVRVREKH